MRLKSQFPGVGTLKDVSDWQFPGVGTLKDVSD